MIPLRGYQQQVKAEVLALWLIWRYVLAVSATGSGKTVLFSDMVAGEPNASCVIAHRHELVSQISLALARNGVRHRIVGSSQLAKECTAAHMEELGVNYVDPNSRVAAASVDTLIRMDEKDPWFASVKLWVMDECFVAGTMIGDVPIERIKVGDIVDAFNEETGQIEKRKVARLFRNPAPKHMVCVAAGHHVLHCTYGHPFFTRRGWVDAGNLTTDDEILEHEMHTLRGSDNQPETASTVCVKNQRKNILSQSVRLGASDCQSETANSKGTATGTVHGLWGAVRSFRASLFAMGKYWSGLLQQGLLRCLSFGSIVRSNDKNQPRARFGQNDSQQSNVEPCNTGEDVSNANQHWSSAETARWKWSPDDRTGKVSADDVRRYGVHPADSDTNISTEGVGISTSLQTGHGQSINSVSSGSGRGEPSGSAASGREERRLSSWVRVDSVEIYERANYDGPGLSSDDGYVYNFEVEGLHTYVANGIVVHNCHHLLKHNKWGKAVAMFPNARGLGVTAETERADGYGLGAMNDGIFQAIVLAPDMREIIGMGYLTDYRVFCPPSDLDLSTVDVGPSGEFVPAKLSKATKASHITGDVVKHYQRIAPGKLGICFAVDIESASDIATGFRDAGVPAEVVSSKTNPKLRRKILRDFRDRRVMMLVNVDLFGEGFDLPAIEVVIMARATASFNLYKQQFGRALRLLAGKTWAIIIDHVGNVIRHGLPDQPKLQTLGRPVPKAKREPDENLIPLTVCTECTKPYIRANAKCTHCGHGRVPMARSGPEFVEGDLTELTQEVLAKMRGDADKVVGPCYIPQGVEPHVAGAIEKRHRQRAVAQGHLRNTLALWAGWQRSKGRDDSFIYRLFYLTYGVDMATAQTLGTPEADELRGKLERKLNAENIVAIT